MISYKSQDVTSHDYANRTSVQHKETIRRMTNVVNPILDLGADNILSRLLGAKNLDTDLNYGNWPEETWPTITCFQVLEHIQNPLLLLENICRHLTANGRLYLTTPAGWILSRYEWHFKEYREEELWVLFKMAGLEIVKLERMRSWNWRGIGIRPVIRWFRDRLWGSSFFIIAKREENCGKGDVWGS